MTALEIFNKAFQPGREPRSDAYRAGVLQLLKHKLEKKPLECLYRAGTAESDAFYAGTHEGHALLRQQTAGGAA